jgi:alcohol dehydrogenase, propanol-preferring
VRDELEDLTGRRDVDAVLDCAGAEESLALGFSILAKEGALASVGLIGQRVQVPLFPFVSGEIPYFGSFWGNYNDLTEVLALAGEDALGRGEMVGRAVVIF